MPISLDGWNIVHNEETDWLPWTGSAGEARAKLLGSAGGYIVALIEAQPGYRGNPHVHAYPEFNYVIEGGVRNQGQEMHAGDGYAAAARSSHDDVITESGATYLVIFRI